ncbi:hypothetical protein C9374_006052 [Naegleria lovaniensis]|uniref:Fatty acid desaturase domain-containing protein n=1 Tax=Naegleria lovaniensis TaxID=51637 RepID=A0AA88GN64_NAELO|nr:uncharacterized protein C9374_006052 [Naegleria lovaniensis]KAG2381668.1 hypothetical protein C9374_006052 [Naegleria lovaniensis]
MSNNHIVSNVAKTFGEDTGKSKLDWTFEDLENLLSSKRLFEPSNSKAMLQLVVTLGLIIWGVVSVVKFDESSYWYLLMPLAWLLLGFCACRLIAVAYGCSTKQFFNSATIPEWINDLLGFICMLPLLYPFENVKSLKKAVLNLTPEEQQVTQTCTNSSGNASKQQVSENHNDIEIHFMFSALLRIVKSPLWFFSSLWECLATHIQYPITSTSIVLNSIVFVLEFLTHYSLQNYKITFKWYHQFHTSNSQETSKPSSLLAKWSNSIPFYRWASARSLLEEKLSTSNKQEDNSIQLAQIARHGSLSDLFSVLSLQGGTSTHPVTYSELVDYLDLRNIDYVISIYLIGSILGSIYGILACPFNWKTYLLAWIGQYSAGIGISTGYHRFFAHLSCEAVWPVRLLILIIGAASFQGSAIQWSSDHRRHHKYIDTEKDPYNIKKSFFYAHMGWLMKTRPVDYSNVPDLTSDPFPTLIAGLGWGDWMGGFWLGGVLSKTWLQHCTFFINSLAHTWGDATFNDDHSARDSYIVSLLTFGEGYHNFHHTFAYDYRNGVRWYHYDPGKWIIYTLSLFGCTYNLRRCDDEHYEKGRIVMKQKQIDMEREKIEELIRQRKAK